ncbi:MAG: DUF4178 domain-containing protein [Elusimicrobia bacterium]|nr:DUF4178 domain-containing protein [Elusimicrobiota bacterium]
MSGSLRCPKCSCPLELVQLPEGVEVECCPNCFGAYYDRSELSVAVELQGAADTERPCPKCGKPLQAGRYREELELEQCRRCLGLWFDAREIQKLRALSGVEGVVRARPGDGEPLMPAAALAAFASQLGEEGERARSAGKGSPKEPPDAPPKIPEGSAMPNPDERRCPILKFQGREYAHFQTSWPVVTYVVGEFPWTVAVGEQAKARDFICPPYLLSEEHFENEKTWSHGEYLEPAEVWAAFGLPGSPPARNGVAPAQPNPYKERCSALARDFGFLAAAAFVAGALLLGRAQNREAFSKSYGYDPLSAEKSVVTELFELGGRASNVEVAIGTNLSNQWAYFGMALINADTDVAFDFGREASYYSGYDDEGRWSEGSPNDSVLLPRVPPGRYYLRIEPETDTGHFGYTVRVTRDVPRPLLPALALLLLALPLGWVWLRGRALEHKRWLESDHPWTTDDDDDE